MRTILTVGVLLILMLAGCGKLQTGQPANIAELWRFRAMEPEATRLMKVRGVVTFATALSDFFVMEDSTGGLLVSLSRGQTFAEVGKLVEVSGRFPDAASPDFFQESSIVVLGDEPLPSAAPVNISEKDINRKVNRRVSLEGVARSANMGRLGLGALIVRSGSTDVRVMVIPAGANDSDRFEGAKVQVSGVLLKQMESAGVRLEVWTSSFSDIRVLRPAEPLSTSASDLPVIRTAQAVHGLSGQEAMRHFPVELTAVVTYFDRRRNMLFVQDKTDGVMTGLRSGSIPALHQGDQVRIRGFTQRGELAPLIYRADVAIIGTAPLPAPQHDMESVFMGQLDSRWAELRGVVRSAEQSSSAVIASIAWGRHEFKAHIQAPLPQVSALIDREVLIQGACATIFHRNHRGWGIELFVPSLSFVSPRSPAVADPFVLPLRPAASLLEFSRSFDFQHRARVRGQVTLAGTSGPAWIRDGGIGVEIESHNAVNIREGDMVDVAGFPDAGNFGPVLKAATMRKLSSGPPVIPLDVDASQASLGKAESQLVRLDATLLSQTVRDGRNLLRLQSGPELFSATIPDTKPFPSLVPGSRLRVTGICLVNADDNRELATVRGFHLNLRSAADVVVLRGAPSFTRERLEYASVVALTMIAIAVLWLLLLRRNVRRQTRLLIAKSAQLEAAHGLVRESLERAREAEALEQSRRRLLELVANDDPLETILTELARKVEKHSRGAVCSLEIRLPNGADFVLQPSEKYIAQIEAESGLPDRRMTVPVLVDGNPTGQITIHSISGNGLSVHDKDAFPSWSQFASLALERRELYEKLFFRAQYDALTGLHNRASLHERFGAELSAAARDQVMLAVLYMDLNGFKKINDNHGHDAGDSILREAAQRIQKAVRRSDIVARIGGDEFVVILVDLAAREDAERIGSLVRSSLSQPMRVGAQTFDCGSSLGIAIFPQDGDNVDVLLKHADQRMYAEKAAIKRARAASRSELAV